MILIIEGEFERRRDVYFSKEGTALIGQLKGETLRIEPWGRDSLRVRATKFPEFCGKDWALTEALDPAENTATITIDGTDEASIENGRIKAVISRVGILTFYRDGKKFLREDYRFYDGSLTKQSICLKERSREWKGIPGGDYSLLVTFEANDGEQIFGMGQYQYPIMDMKGCVLPLEQRNSQASVPFYVSNMNYGMLWNNPCTGKVTFGKNITEWKADALKDMDYWLTVGDAPADIIEKYTAVTGRAPMMRDDLMGLWQCKLRYRTQDEVLEVAREYKKRGIRLDVIVIDFFHWTLQGDWDWDYEYWPDPKAMCDELHEMGTKVIVSVWPSVDKKSKNFGEMLNRGFLVATERGTDETYDFQGDCLTIDVTNPAAREFLWDKCKKHYYDFGIDMFWMDNSEPDLVSYDFDNIRYYIGPGQEVSNLYPQMYARTFSEGIDKDAPGKFMLSLARAAWAGNAKYGTVVWSGDIQSNFETLKTQIMAGQSMGIAGIPWWTTDIGGFMTEDRFTDEFRELLLRWYQYAAFTPVLRMHGDRGPYNIPPLDNRDWGGGYLHTGQPNELWSYGEEAYQIMLDILHVREGMLDYIHDIYMEAHTTGLPLIRAMFIEFPEDKKCWDLPDQFMFGPDYLIAPITELGARSREVYLPAGKWENIFEKKTYEGGQCITADAPIEYIPVYKKIK